MTTREEIREEIERILDELLFSPGESDDGYTYNLTGCITNLLNYLHSQGVVIKVDRELPIITDIGWGVSAKKEQVKMLEAGYVAVEPLIIEG